MWSEHGDKVGIVDEEKLSAAEGGQDFFDTKTDALITNLPGVTLFNSYADCLPVFFFDPQRKAVGLAHAGWRSLLSGIIPNTIAAMSQHYATTAADLRVWVAPSIHLCCFEIRDDVMAQFREHAFSPGTMTERDGRTYVDLQEIALRQLVSVGVVQENIDISTECTCCQPERFFSYRRDGRGGALGNAIGLKN